MRIEPDHVEDVVCVQGTGEARVRTEAKGQRREHQAAKKAATQGKPSGIRSCQSLTPASSGSYPLVLDISSPPLTYQLLLVLCGYAAAPVALVRRQHIVPRKADSQVCSQRPGLAPELYVATVDDVIAA